VRGAVASTTPRGRAPGSDLDVCDLGAELRFPSCRVTTYGNYLLVPSRQRDIGLRGQSDNSFSRSVDSLFMKNSLFMCCVTLWTLVALCTALVKMNSGARDAAQTGHKRQATKTGRHVVTQGSYTAVPLLVPVSNLCAVACARKTVVFGELFIRTEREERERELSLSRRAEGL